MTKREKQERKENAVKRLREILKPGDTVGCVLLKRSSSGMYRHIKVLANTDEGPMDISGLVSDALECRWHEDGSVGVGGCGMDMGFHIVYELGHTLFRDGYHCPGKNCLSSEHQWQGAFPAGKKGKRRAKNTFHASGAYALSHRWM